MVKKPKTDFRYLARQAAAAAEEKKALHVSILDIHRESDIADFVVIVEAGSSAQLRALEGAMDDALESLGTRLLRREGRSGDRWIVMDFGGLMIHIMLTEIKERYRLETLWEHAKGVKP